jgi:hypothetical protein
VNEVIRLTAHRRTEEIVFRRISFGINRGRFIAILALLLSSPALAVTYTFKTSSGGQHVPQITRAGSYVFVEVSPGAANTVLFTFTSRIPQPVSSLARFIFDTGTHKDLFASMSVLRQFGCEVTPTKNAQHAYLSTFTPDYSFGVAEPGVLYDRRALQPGDILTIAAVLGPGKTIEHVAQALNQGISADPNVAKAGLRIGVLAYHLLGKRPDPKVTIMDDAGFVTAGVLSR